MPEIALVLHAALVFVPIELERPVLEGGSAAGMSVVPANCSVAAPPRTDGEDEAPCVGASFIGDSFPSIRAPKATEPSVATLVGVKILVRFATMLISLSILQCSAMSTGVPALAKTFAIVLVAPATFVDLTTPSPANDESLSKTPGDEACQIWSNLIALLARRAA